MYNDVKYKITYNFTKLIYSLDGTKEVTITIHTHKKIRKDVQHNKKFISDKLVSSPIYHNDLTGKLWSYDFKVKDFWVENISFSNDLKHIECYVI